MKNRHVQLNASIWHRVRLLALNGLLLCVFFLSACSAAAATQTQSKASPTASMKSTPTVGSTLQKEGDLQLQAFQQWIALMQQYQGNVTTYQQQYTSDQQALRAATTDTAYTAALRRLTAHVAAIQIPAMKTESNSLLQELQQNATNFGKQHTFRNSYDNTTYQYGYEYGSKGASGPLWIQGELSMAKTVADYQQIIEYLNIDLTNFRAMAANFNDKTSYNQVHQTDIQLLQRYQFMNERVIVVSLIEQALRVYEKGKLVKAFQVTTGQPNLPTPPGTWWVEGKQSPTVFRSGAPPSSPEWYPPTPINYAMQFHSNGYFLHDSWWRTLYGPGTNFPHPDPGGSQFALRGSHGCVSMSLANAQWLYGFVQVNTSVVIY